MASTHRRVAALGVYLEPDEERSVRVGTLLRDAHANVSFVVDESYIDLGPDRPTLSSRWNSPDDEEKTIDRLLDRNDKMARGGFLPAWFANLLPEGALRAIVENQLGPGRHDDFDAIAHLGADLPGAVVVRSDSAADETSARSVRNGTTQATPASERAPSVRFSLAGVQLKFSMRMAREKLALPARNELGDIVAKLPSERFPGLPEAEYTTMKLAEAAGVNIPEVQLVPTERVEGLPEKWLSIGANILAVKRFDRSGGARIHMEDFAQIIGAVGDRKYTMSNEETNMRVVKRFCRDPAGSVLQAIRRIVVNILTGNGDAHLKNWSLVYQDAGKPVLSPAYDIVPTWVFDGDQTLALSFGGTKTASLITLRKFERAAGFLEMDARAIVREAQGTIERAADTWPDLVRALPIERTAVAALRRRWETLALSQGFKNGFRRSAASAGKVRQSRQSPRRRGAPR